MNDEILTIVDCQFPIEKVDAGMIESAVANQQSAITSSHPITIRAGTMDDLPFIDSLQKKQSRALGFLPTMALEGKIRLGQVLVAEATGVASGEWLMAREDGMPRFSNHSPLTTNHTVPVGYLIAADRYFKRDEIGYVTQISVVPEYRRSLVAGMLLQAQFDRSAYGCKLYCCWCAQDLEANAFWESMGFTAIAFRTGSMTKGKKLPIVDCQLQNEDGENATAGQSTIGNRKSAVPRVHIFWQKRVRAGDTTTPWWYPSTTGGGEMRADRLVFPIMPGVNWRNVKPIRLPEQRLPTAECQLPNEKTARPSKRVSKIGNLKSAIGHSPRRSLVGAHVTNGLRFEPSTPVGEAGAPKQKSAKPPKETVKIDPRLIAMSRELRDKWAEQVAPTMEAALAKHDVRKIVAVGAQTSGARMLAA